jgi:hypothetical protein
LRWPVVDAEWGGNVIRKFDAVGPFKQDDLASDVFVQSVLAAPPRLRRQHGNHIVLVDDPGEHPFQGLMNAMYTWRKTDGQWRVIIGVLLSDGDPLPAPGTWIG